jgi:hypothetical protein
MIPLSILELTRVAEGREILVQEQDHLIALATALGIDAPDPGKPDKASRKK